LGDKKGSLPIAFVAPRVDDHEKPALSARNGSDCSAQSIFDGDCITNRGQKAATA
jgi:hypothetical protein